MTLAYGDAVIQHDLNFTVNEGDIFVIMGGSGCGKSTLLKHMIGLMAPAQGEISYGGNSFWPADEPDRARMLRNFGVLFQGGALWTSMTLEENVALPLQQFTLLRQREISEICSLKLSLVGLAGFEEYYPAEISGGMRKRAALARAIALDPQILFFDEPSAGLDPINSRRLDDLILELSHSLGATVIIVSHELASIFTIASNSVFLDGETKTMLAVGDPRKLRKECTNSTVREFLHRGAGNESGA